MGETRIHSRVPTVLCPLLDEYTSLVQQDLPDLINGFYVVGSIALGEFNEHFSDIDFVAVLQHQVNSDELEHLGRIHNIIEQKYPRWPMSGSYLQVSNLGYCNSEVTPHPYYHDGRLYPQGHFELNPVTWWVLKNHAIALVGPEPVELPFNADSTMLIAYMRENLNSYWAGWTKRPDRVVALFSNRGIQWAVLGVLRQFYSFREQSVTTKEKAGEYGIKHIPERWHCLITEALNLRAGSRRSLYRLRVVRTIEAILFLRRIIHMCNTDLQDQLQPVNVTQQ